MAFFSSLVFAGIIHGFSQRSWYKLLEKLRG
jgi:hypothetical protein